MAPLLLPPDGPVVTEEALYAALGLLVIVVVVAPFLGWNIEIVALSFSA